MDMRGRWYRWDKKPITDEVLNLDMTTFAKRVDLTCWWAGSFHWTWTSGRKESISYTVEPGQGVRLRYMVNKERDYDYLVHTTTTPQRLGGVRWWWLCPQCGRRVRILYSGELFVCRRCAGVYYATQQSKELMVRTDNQLYRIRRKLGATGGSVADSMPPPKPKGMHWRTYARLAQRYVDLQRLRNDSFAAEITLRWGDTFGYDKAQGQALAKLVKGEWKAFKRSSSIK